MLLQGLDEKQWQQFVIFDMALFTRVQHLCIFNIVADLIYHLLSNVWKASYSTSASIFVDLPYWSPYSRGKFISSVVPGPSQMFFRVGEEIVIAWTQKEMTTLRAKTQSFFMKMQRVTPLLSLNSWAAGHGRFWNIHCAHLMSPCIYDLFAKVKEPLQGTRYNTRYELIRAIGR